jgi:membrane-associated phospholipid phosphatase
MAIFKPLLRALKKIRAPHSFPFIIYLIGYMIWFHFLEVVPRRHYVEIILPIDRKIPFAEIFVLPYLSWFLFIAVGSVLVYYMDRDVFNRMSTALMAGMTVFLLISTFIPNRQPLRLLQMPRDNVFTHLVAYIWRTDTPSNVWPSIHVFNSVTVTAGIFKSRYWFLQKKPVRVITAIWCVLICMSTVLIKQHSLFDVLTALIMASVCYLVIDVHGHYFQWKKWDKWTGRLEARV